MAVLLAARAIEIEVKNNFIPSETINVDIMHDFSVSFTEDGEHCRATLKAGIEAKDSPETLTVRCTMIGEFSIKKIESDEDKKLTHIDCYYMIFPYAQALIQRLCVDAGLPPFYMQEIEQKVENIPVR